MAYTHSNTKCWHSSLCTWQNRSSHHLAGTKHCWTMASPMDFSCAETVQQSNPITSQSLQRWLTSEASSRTLFWGFFDESATCCWPAVGSDPHFAPWPSPQCYTTKSYWDASLLNYLGGLSLLQEPQQVWRSVTALWLVMGFFGLFANSSPSMADEWVIGQACSFCNLVSRRCTWL